MSSLLSQKKAQRELEELKEKDRIFDELKSQIVGYVRQEGYKGTIIDWMKKLNNYDELSVGSAIAELTFERKMQLLDKKQIYECLDGEPQPVIMGIYGPPRTKQQ